MATLGGYDDLVRLIRIQRAIFRQNYEHKPHTDGCALFLDRMEHLRFHDDGDNGSLESTNFPLSCLELIVVCQEAIREGIGGWQSRFKDDLIGDLERKWKEHFLSLPIALQVDEDKVWQTFKAFYSGGLAKLDEEAARKVLEEEERRNRETAARTKTAAAAEELASHQRLLERLQTRRANACGEAERKVYEDAANKVAEAKAAEEKRNAKNLEAERKRIEAKANAAQEILEAKIIEGERKQHEAEERAAKEAQKALELEEERKRIEAETRAAQEKLDEERQRKQREKLEEERKRIEAEAKEEASAAAAAAAAASRNEPMVLDRRPANDLTLFRTPTRRKQHRRTRGAFML